MKFLRRGKRLGALSAQALLARDSRSPVVYLRSFQDDPVAAEGSLTALPLGGGLILSLITAGLDLLGGVMTEEEQLAEALQEVGPVHCGGQTRRKAS